MGKRVGQANEHGTPEPAELPVHPVQLAPLLGQPRCRRLLGTSLRRGKVSLDLSVIQLPGCFNGFGMWEMEV